MKIEKKQWRLITSALLLLGIVFLLSLFVGQYPLHIKNLWQGDEQAIRVFMTLRFPRTCMAALTGAALGIVGMIYQTVFQNPLASPDIIGVSSGACAGAAFAILFCTGSSLMVTLCAFGGSLSAVILALGLAVLVPKRGNITIVLSGLAVQSLAQTILMTLKLTADPEKELAAIEYWIMGSLHAITGKDVWFPFGVVMVSTIILGYLYRQILMLSMEEEEAAMLGVSVSKMRLMILLLATLMVAAVVCVTGVIGFVGLIAPHCARMVMKNSRIETLWFSGILGSVFLLIADILARSVAASELPVSVFTTLVGVPFLIGLMLRKDNS